MGGEPVRQHAHVESGELGQHREPTIRGFMPDPSIFRDMDARWLERSARAVAVAGWSRAASSTVSIRRK